MKGASWGLLAITSSALVGLISWISLPSPQQFPSSEPAQHRDEGYLGSGACKACHPSEYESWKSSFHHSMTRSVTELTWDGVNSPQLPVELTLDGRHFRIEKRQHQVFVVGPDLHRFGRQVSRINQLNGSADELRKMADDTFQTLPQTNTELSLITGSHHYLAFWVGEGVGQELRQLPFIFRLEEGKFLPRREAFLQPPNALPHVSRWNSNCIQCHSVAGRPRQTEGNDDVTGEFWENYESDAAELGIGCESCHGPGERHADHFRNPLRRHRLRTQDGERPVHITNPVRLSSTEERNPCGQCHSYFLPDDPLTWWESGFSENYRAGDLLSESRTILRKAPRDERERRALKAVSAHQDSIFWHDGSMIVGGREYNGLITSPCYEHGEGKRKLSCTSCHTMHQGSPNDQLAPKFEKNPDEMCTQCHTHTPKTHSRHPPDSAGSRCVNCHMPKTSYALLKAIRSHRITSPTLATTSPPNGCALCHVDKTQSDLDAQLALFHTDTKSMVSSQEQIPWAAQQALSGNAIQRAIFAYSLGAEETRAASGTAIPAQLLKLLSADSYAAVRHIAKTSQSRLPLEKKETNPLSKQAVEELLQAQDQTPIVVSE